MSENGLVRFTTSLPQAEFDELVRAANLAQRSLLAEASVRLRASLGERDGGDIRPSLSRSPSVALLRADSVASPVVCPHGRALAVCEDPSCKERRRAR